MALSTYGSSLDLHAGGADLRFPHHAYESAQAEAATGVAPFARSWLHIGTVRLDGEKMAKSTGNLVFVRDCWPQRARRSCGRCCSTGRTPCRGTTATPSSSGRHPAGRAAVRRRPAAGAPRPAAAPSSSASSTTSTCRPRGTSRWRRAAPAARDLVSVLAL
jgi:cysteinyl-tRNA synthetase